MKYIKPIFRTILNGVVVAPLALAGCGESLPLEHTDVESVSVALKTRHVSEQLVKLTGKHRSFDIAAASAELARRQTFHAVETAEQHNRQARRSQSHEETRTEATREMDTREARSRDTETLQRSDDERRDARESDAEEEREIVRARTRRGFSCDTAHAPQGHEPMHALTGVEAEDEPHRVLVVPVTYINPNLVPDRNNTSPAVNPYYPPMMDRDALQAEMFGLSTSGSGTTGFAHVKNYLEDMTEGQVEVEGVVTDWAQIHQLPPLQADKCGQELFHSAVYPDDHPEFDPEQPNATRKISPVLEAALLAQGIDNVDDFDTLGLVTACHADMMRGVAPWGTYELFGKRVKLAISSHPYNSDIVDYWNFSGAIPLGNVSRNMIHEILHTWGIGHARAAECDEASLAEDCSTVMYGSPFSVMGNPTGIFSLDLMDRKKLGAVDDDDFVHVTQGGTYTISGLNEVGADHRGAFVYWHGTEHVRFALQFRNALGFDSAIAANWLNWIQTGLTIHVNAVNSTNMAAMNQSSFQNWRLVDPVPENNETEHYDRQSVITGTFHDPHAGITIEVLNVTEDSIQFSVDFEDEVDMVVPNRR